MIRQYDAIVVGSGPGGFTCALELAMNGLKVALVEGEKLGGTCLNRGCIPKEGLYRIAKEAISLKRKLGVEVKLDFSKALNYVKDRVARIRRNAELVDNGILKVGRNLYLKGGNIILACGSKPKEQGISPEDIFTGGIIPKNKVLIEGSGASACELAFILSAFGFETYLKVEERLLKDYPLEEEFVEKLERELEVCGVSLVDTFVDADTHIKATGTHIKATGRIPNICREAFPFIEFDEEGYVKVNESLATNMEGVYAVGDITKPMGACHAIAKARCVSRTILGSPTPYRPDTVPIVICSALELGYVGKPTKGKRITKTMNSNTKSFVNGWKGMLSLIVDEDGKLSYCAMLGEGVSESLNYIVTLMSSYLWDEVIYQTPFVHPSICEIFGDVALEFMFNRM